ncbi:enoyl-CoA hydratase/isomerase family protein [Terrabacter carboxydivorans]|uniref:Enoyl-CoA hydratase-related protein n=1 Tax=Terrabacter carboxydivorans TaxID=619730 RepID=A0ABN3M250_9MICO
MTTTLPPVSLSASDGVATIRLTRPDAGNALDLPGAVAFRDAVAEVASAVDRVRVVVLRSDGRLFCAGGDVRAMAAAADRPAFVAELAGVLHASLEALRALPVPVVAVVQGAAAGAGVGLVLAADVVLAADHTTFVAAYPSVGLSPDCGVSALLPAVVGARRAALFLLTGTPVDAATALDWGLVSEVCPAETLDARAGEVVAAIAALPRQAVGEAARLVRRSGERSYAASLADEAATIARLAATTEAGDLLEAFARPHPTTPTPPTDGDTP